MSEETETTEQESSTAEDDSRFEVKWKKKESSSRPTVAPEVALGASADASGLRSELDAAQERIRDLQDKWQRAAADLVNLRRRTEQERGEMEQFASMLLVSELLPVLDNFERALATIPGNLAMLTWIQGVMLIERHLQALLEHRGLEEIEAKDQQFSPHYHEAVGERETEEAAPGTIVQVYQKGYTMHGRVIRPALVEVAKAAASEGSTPASDAQSTDEAEVAEIADEAENENVGP